MLGAIRDEFGLADDAEITTEANPESVDPAYLATLREGGFNRISFGMQSASSTCCSVLDRTHTPGRPEACVAEARAAGFEHVNLDLIYGTPGETDDDWRETLDGGGGRGARPCLGVRADRGGGHSAGPAHPARRGPDDGRRRARGPVSDRGRGARPGGLLLVRGVQLGHLPGRPLPAQRAVLARRGLVGRGPRRPQPRRRGPLVERQTPRRLRLGAGGGPLAGRGPGDLSARDRRVERILLELRLSDGCQLYCSPPRASRRPARRSGTGCSAPEPFEAGRAVLTLRGRLLADAVVRDLVD